MTQRVFVPLLTIIVFLAGYAARVWTEPRHAVPPAPVALTQEYARVAKTPGDGKVNRQFDRAKLVAEIEKLRPQIVAYQGQIEEISSEFDREFVQLLTPPQREKYGASQKKHAERDAKRIANRAPLTDEDIRTERERPLTEIYWYVTITPRLEWLTKEYSLDAAQQSSTRALLSLRRNKFMALFDSTPHPSIRLSRLAPLIERVAAAPAKP